MQTAHSRSNFGLLGQQAKRKLSDDNDIKIIIQGTNSQTGIGKTTLAIQLCRFIDDGWNAKDKAFIDTREYINAHLEMPKGSALLIDEIEAGADSRRAMSQENVDLSHAWATLRDRNIASVTTLPTISMLDGRMLELADYWVLVKNRGMAQPYEIHVNDFTHKVQRKPLPGEEHIQFVDLSDGDPDKEYLDQIKDEMVKSDGNGYISQEEHQEKVEKEKENALREFRDEVIKEMYNQFDVTYRDISDVDSLNISYQRVGEIMKEATA